MKTIQYKLLILISILLMSACIKPIVISIPQAKQKLAIFSQIIPNHIVMVGVTRSFSALNQLSDSTTNESTLSGLLVSRAFVTIRHDLEIDTLKKIMDGVYGSSTVNLVPNETYELNVYDSTSGESVRSFTQVKPFVKDSLHVIIDKSSTDTIIHFNLKIEDDASTEDYYYVDFAPRGNSDFLNDSSRYFNRLVSTSAVYIMSDKEAVNGIIEKDFDAGSFVNYIGAHDSVTVVVANISKSYYQFIDAYKRGNSLFSQIFGEPVNYPSNVENGYGLFTAHLPDIYFLDMKDY